MSKVRKRAASLELRAALAKEQPGSVRGTASSDHAGSQPMEVDLVGDVCEGPPTHTSAAAGGELVRTGARSPTRSKQGKRLARSETDSDLVGTRRPVSLKQAKTGKSKKAGKGLDKEALAKPVVHSESVVTPGPSAAGKNVAVSGKGTKKRANKGKAVRDLNRTPASAGGLTGEPVCSPAAAAGYESSNSSIVSGLAHEQSETECYLSVEPQASKHVNPPIVGFVERGTSATQNPPALRRSGEVIVTGPVGGVTHGPAFSDTRTKAPDGGVLHRAERGDEPFSAGLMTRAFEPRRSTVSVDSPHPASSGTSDGRRVVRIPVRLASASCSQAPQAPSREPEAMAIDPPDTGPAAGAGFVDQTEEESIHGRLFDVIGTLLPDTVRTSVPQSKQPVRSFADRILQKSLPAPSPFRSLPLSQDVEANLASVWHGVIDSRLRPVDPLASDNAAVNILRHSGGTESSLLTGSMPKPPKVGDKVYSLHPAGTLAAAPMLAASLVKPKDQKVLFANQTALLEDWRVSLRMSSFLDTLTGALAQVASDTKSETLVVLTTAIGKCMGDLSSTIAHGYASQLLSVRDGVLAANSSSKLLKATAGTARVGPPLHPDLLPDAIADVKEVKQAKETQLQSDFLATLNRCALKGAQAGSASSTSGNRSSTTLSRSAWRNKKRRQAKAGSDGAGRGRGSSFPAAARGANQPSRGKGRAARGKGKKD